MARKLTLATLFILGSLSLGIATSSTIVINEAVAQNGQNGTGR